MYIIIAYDISDDGVRSKVRRLLWRNGLCYLSRSVYGGRLRWGRVLILARVISGLVGDRDSALIIPMPDSWFRRSVFVTRGLVHDRWNGGVLVLGADP